MPIDTDTGSLRDSACSNNNLYSEVTNYAFAFEELYVKSGSVYHNWEILLYNRYIIYLIPFHCSLSHILHPLVIIKCDISLLYRMWVAAHLTDECGDTMVPEWSQGFFKGDVTHPPLFTWPKKDVKDLTLIQSSLSRHCPFEQSTSSLRKIRTEWYQNYCIVAMSFTFGTSFPLILWYRTIPMYLSSITQGPTVQKCLRLWMVNFDSGKIEPVAVRMLDVVYKCTYSSCKQCNYWFNILN